MEHRISVIFHKDIELIHTASRSIFYFRRQDYKKALETILETIDLITVVVEQIIEAKDYFRQDICKEVCDLLTEILNAKKNLDYVLLADLQQLHLIPLILQIQEIICEREDGISYTKERYDSNVRTLYGNMAESQAEQESILDYSNRLAIPLRTKELIDEGYRIELTPSGVMTAAVVNEQTTFYLHSKQAPLYEAFLLADAWYEEQIDSYLVYGLGMGYHIQELCRMAGKTANICVYESDIQMIKLSCAFTSYLWMKEFPSLRIIYDPQLNYMKAAVKEKKNSKLCIHYPSFRNIKERALKVELESLLPVELKLLNG